MACVVKREMWQDVASLLSQPMKCIKTSNSLAPFFAAEQCLNGRSHMGVGIAIEVTTNFWIGEDAFQNDTMPSGVRETIKLWTQAGTSSEHSVGVIYGRWGGAIGGDDKRILSLWRRTGYSALVLCVRGSQSTELWVQCVNPYPLPSLITSPRPAPRQSGFLSSIGNKWVRREHATPWTTKIRPIYSLALQSQGEAYRLMSVLLSDIIITPRS